MHASRSRWLLAGLIGVTSAGLGGIPTATADPVSAANAAAPPIVEDFTYPGAAQILADRGITLTGGDGHILLADDCNTAQIKVWSRLPSADVGQFCFNSTAAHGSLTMSIDKVIGLQSRAQPLTASMTTGTRTDTVTVPKGETKGVGEGAPGGSRSVLLQLTVDSPTAPTPPATPVGDAAYTARIDIGDGKRSCTGALVDRSWVITAASCFADDPAKPATLAAGAPKWHTTATIGRPDLTNTGAGAVADIVELAPRTDRDLVMARLAFPVTGITPAAMGGTAPVSGEALRVTGYGRTSALWAPTALHAASVAAGAGDATGVDLAWQDAGTTVCAGDAGAPVTRTVNGQTQLVAVTSRSWQSGCLNTTTPNVGAYAVRTDGIAAWVKQVREAALSATAPTAGGVYDPVKQTSTVFTVDDKGRVVGAYNINGQGWSSWSSISDRPAGVKPFVGSPTALYNPATNAIELFATDTDGLMWHTYYMADAQGWRPWAGTGATSFTGSATAVYNPSTKTAEVFATTADGPVAHMYYTPGMTDWSTWSNINADYRFTGSPKALYNPATDALELFAIGRDNTMYHTYWANDGKPWSPWLQLNRNTFTGSPSLVYNPSTKTAEVFATDPDGLIAHSYYTAGTAGWSAWTTIKGDLPFTGSPSVLYNPATDALELFAIRSDKSFQHTYWFNDGKPWSAWESLATTKFAGRIPAALFSGSSNTVDLFAAGDTGAVNHTSYKPGMPKWAPVDTLAGTTLPGIALPTS
ncbi:trypsin-like serine protease [Kitasatospora sp. NPDC056446]|uniref:trypsin-like serine protease n=1 Tax=Kitasatospora sp. NPDC056446 TaxID=3345819 RepID=UPI0036C04B4F